MSCVCDDESSENANMIVLFALETFFIVKSDVSFYFRDSQAAGWRGANSS